MRQGTLTVALLSLLVIIFCSGCPSGPEIKKDDSPKTITDKSILPEGDLTSVEWTGELSEGWGEYDKLVDEQKFEQASLLVEKMLEQAKATGDSEEWTRALIRYVQLRSGLHGYETSARFLIEQDWPADLLGYSVLNLFYARMLVDYAQSYSWEIQQRERVESKEAIDLKVWTLQQIYAEAHKAYGRVWVYRDQLGSLPISHLSEYITPNDYPREIRGTLRDSLSYFWVALWSDSMGWTPAQSNEIYKLDFAALLESGGQLPNFDDPSLHPLVKAVGILKDLEAWHLASGKPEAAFEAYLKRLEHLYPNFSKSEESTAIKENLKNRLAGVQNVPWWSMGMEMLATYIRNEETPDNLIRARQIAEDGAKAYPDSIGGKRCNYFVQSIDQISYSLEGMSIDGLNKKSIGINYQNIKRGPDILFDNTLILLNNKMDICGCSKTQFPLINSRIGNVHLKTVSGSR